MLIIGVHRKEKPVENGLTVCRYCSNCRCERELKEYRVRRYFALFFIPLLPVDKGESVLRCSGCGHLYHVHADDYAAAGAAKGDYPVISLPCIYCQKMIPVTVTGKATVVECPRCGSTFELGRENRS